MIEGLVLGVPPGVLLVLAAVPTVWLPRRLSQALMLLLPIVGLGHVIALPDLHSQSMEAFGYELQIVRVDALARIFGGVFHLAAFMGVLYALHVRDRLQGAAALVYMGSAIAAVFAGDLLTLFVWWELTAISSVLLVWARRTESARRAGMRYLLMQVASGLLLLAGSILLYRERGTLAFGQIGIESAAGWLLLVAFGIKAAFPLVHGWMKDAYPEATVTGTVFLSAFTTKLAIYALARGFAGSEILIPIGATMAIFPIFFAVIESDLRRVLCYSLNNQLGFMVVGIGIGTELALNGAVAHVYASAVYQTLLFMAMGAVLLRAGTVESSELGGLYKSMPWTTGFCVVGAASISAFPMTSGFVTKSMILSAAGHGHEPLLFLALLFASAGALYHSGIKVPFFAFFGRDRGVRVKEAPWNMLAAMGIASFLSIGLGIFPGSLYRMLPHPVDYEPYTPTHVMTVLQLLLFSALAFVGLMKAGLYPKERRSTVLDVDWTYRRLLPRLWRLFGEQGSSLQDRLLGVAKGMRRSLLDVGEAHLSPWTRFGEPWPTGATAMWAALLLLAYPYLAY
ncbi:MAG: Na(+)/H(+) antiporter subunit D [bacterium]